MAKRKSTNTIAKVAGAAAAAAVREAEHQRGDVLLNWGTDREDDDEEATAQVLEDLERIDDDAGGEITWELYCDTPLEKAGQIRKLARTELRGLRDECLALGPGQYHVIARDGQTGSFVKGSRRNIKISGFARSAAPATQPLDTVSLFQQLEDRAERRRQDDKAEWNSKLRFWAPLLAPIGLELAKNLFGNRGGGESMKDLVAALVSMKQLTEGGNNSEKTLDTLLKGIELARDLAPDPKGSTWPDMVTTIAKELRPVAEALGTRRQANGGAPPAPAPALPNVQLATPVARPPEAPTVPAEDQVFEVVVKPLLERLAGELEEFAVNGADPGLTAEALLAKVPRLMRAQVTPAQMKEWLTQPNWWVLTVQFRATLQPYQAYCDDVRLALLEMAERELSGETDTETAES